MRGDFYSRHEGGEGEAAARRKCDGCRRTTAVACAEAEAQIPAGKLSIPLGRASVSLGPNLLAAPAAAGLAVLERFDFTFKEGRKPPQLFAHNTQTRGAQTLHPQMTSASGVVGLSLIHI